MKRLRGDGPSIDPTARVTASHLGRWTEVGARTSIVESTLDDYSYVVHDAEIIYARIGRFCSIAAHTRINPGNHPLDRVALHHFTYRSAQYGMAPDDASFFDWRRGFSVDIGHDVWIGHGAIVLPGVTIGTGAAVGAGAVVRHDIDPFTVVAGVPARPIRRRFCDETVADLLALAWWNWPDDRIGQALPDFRDLGAEAFVVKYRGT